MLTAAEIQRFISDDINSEKKKRAAIGQRYYEGEHDIKNCRFFYWNADEKLVEDTTRTNNKICHPFFTELSDQLSSYMLSFHENPIRAKENVEGLQDHLDLYFDEEFWAEISELISGTYNKGFDYIYGYKSKEDRLKFSHADGMGVVEVRENDVDDKCKHILYWYIDRIDKGKKVVKRIQDWTEKEVCYYVQVDDGKIKKDKSEKINPRPHVVYTDESGKRMGHPLGYIPFWRLDNNKKQFSGLKPIKGLIDDYDIMQCGLSNNLADFDTPLHVVKGFQGDNLTQLQQNLRTKKIIGVDAEGDVEIRTVDIPYQARQAKANDDEKNIYRFGMGLNTAGLKDTSATTNLAIKAAYALLDMKANKMETRLKRLLKDIIKVVLAEINDANKTAFSPSDVFFDFKRETMANETENIANDKVKAETKQTEVNTILSVAATVGDEQTLKLLCESLDINFDEIKGQLEEMQEGQDTQTAKNVIDAVVPDDEPVE